MTTESPQVKALRERYQQSLSSKSEMLGELIESLTSANDELPPSVQPEETDMLAEYLHKLAGSAGMYGYDDVAQLAREAMSDRRQGDSPDLFPRLTKLQSLLEHYARS